MTIQFHGRVAVVTGAGSGLGRSHALGIAARGAKVVVNDLGRNGAPSDNALSVVEEIRAGGGTAIADPADVANFERVSAMAARAEKDWGGVDILVNNAGVLCDKTFAKMEMADFELVLRVHLIGSANCTKAVWRVCGNATMGASCLRPRGPAFTAILARRTTAPRRRP